MADISTIELKSNCSCQVSSLLLLVANWIWNVDSIKWGLRFPNRFPVAEPNIKYRKETEQQILNFLGDKFSFDISGGDEDLNLDMTLEEAEYLILASESIKEKSKSGELAALNQWMRDFYDKKQTLLIQMYDQLDRVLQ